MLRKRPALGAAGQSGPKRPKLPSTSAGTAPLCPAWLCGCCCETFSLPGCAFLSLCRVQVTYLVQAELAVCLTP